MQNEYFRLESAIFAFWPLTPLPKVQINTLQIAIKRTHQSFLYFTVIFHAKKNNLCVMGDFMSKMIPKMISLNFAGLLQHSTRFFMHTLNDVFGQNLAILDPNTIEHVT